MKKTTNCKIFRLTKIESLHVQLSVNNSIVIYLYMPDVISGDRL